MGYMRHHAIVVTTWNHEFAEKAHSFALNTGASVSPLVHSTTNGYYSFLVAPDGSKEGWERSNTGDSQRHEIVCHLETYRYGDGSTSVKYVEVQYGDEEGVTKIICDDAHPMTDLERLATVKSEEFLEPEVDGWRYEPNS